MPPVDGAATYDLFVTRTDVPTAGIINLTGLTSASYTPTTPLPIGTYRAWVRAISTTAESRPWSLQVDFTITADANEPGFVPGDLLLTELTNLATPNLHVSRNPSPPKSAPVAEAHRETVGAQEFMTPVNSIPEPTESQRLPVEQSGGNREMQLMSESGDEIVDLVMAELTSTEFLLQI